MSNVTSRVVGSLLGLLRSLLERALGDRRPWTVRPAVEVRDSGFVLTVAYEVETAGRPQLYVRVEDDGTGEAFFWMERIDSDRDELVLPVGPDLVPDGNRFSVAVVVGDGTVRRESPVEHVAVPPDPGVGPRGGQP